MHLNFYPRLESIRLENSRARFDHRRISLDFHAIFHLRVSLEFSETVSNCEVTQCENRWNEPHRSFRKASRFALQPRHADSRKFPTRSDAFTLQKEEWHRNPCVNVLLILIKLALRSFTRRFSLIKVPAIRCRFSSRCTLLQYVHTAIQNIIPSSNVHFCSVWNKLLLLLLLRYCVIFIFYIIL